MSQVSLELLYSSLNRYNLCTGLENIGILMSLLEFENYEINQSINPKVTNIAKWLTNLQNRHADVVEQLRIVAPRSARYILLSKAAPSKTKYHLSPGTREFDKVRFNTLNVHEDSVCVKFESMDDLSLFMARESQWQFPVQEAYHGLISRAYSLFVLIPNDLGLYSVFNDALQNAIQMSIDEYIFTGFLLGIMTNGIITKTKPHRILIENTPIKDTSIDSFIKASCITQRDYKVMIRGKNDWQYIIPERDMYSFDPLVSRPIVTCCMNDNVKNIIPVNQYCIHKASMGLYHVLADYERIVCKSNSGVFKSAFGRVYETYVKKLLSKCIYDETELYCLDDHYDDNTSKPDFALVFKDMAIIIEVKSTIMNIYTKHLVTDKWIEKDTLSQFSKAICQLDRFENRIAERATGISKLDGVSKVI